MTAQTLRWYLVRHGITDWNQAMRMQGQTDIEMNAEGREQARRIGLRLAHTERPPQAVWSSDLQRAQATAEAIAAPLKIPVHTTPLLRELMLGQWEGLNLAEIEARGDAELYRRYRLSPCEQRPPGGETLEAAWDRMMQARNEIRSVQKTGEVAVVGHGGTLRALLCAALDAPVASMLRFTLANASLSVIEEVATEQTHISRVLLVNDTSHLHAAPLAPAPSRTGHS